MTSTDITLLGLGNMGVALASTLLKTSSPLTIWNRTTNKSSITPLINSGAILQPSLSTALSSAPIIIICLLDYHTINTILSRSSITSSIKDKIIINLTNGTPRQARTLERWMKDKAGVKYYLDGGIMAPPQLIGTEHSFVFISGEDEEVLRESGVRSVVERFGKCEYVGSDAGNAALHDLALLTGMYGMFSGLLTASALLRTASPSAPIAPKISNYLNPLLQAMLPTNVALVEQLDRREYPADGHPLGMQIIALENILEACKDEGVDGGAFVYFVQVVKNLGKLHGDEGGIARVGEMLLTT